MFFVIQFLDNAIIILQKAVAHVRNNLFCYYYFRKIAACNNEYACPCE